MILTWVARVRNLQTVDKCARNPQQPMFSFFFCWIVRRIFISMHIHIILSTTTFPRSIVDYSFLYLFLEYLSPLCTCQCQWVYALLQCIQCDITMYMHALEQCSKIPPFEKTHEATVRSGFLKSIKCLLLSLSLSYVHLISPQGRLISFTSST